MHDDIGLLFRTTQGCVIYMGFNGLNLVNNKTGGGHLGGACVVGVPRMRSQSSACCNSSC